MVAWRDAAYYEMMLAEQISENGGILIVRRKSRIEGLFCFAKEGRIEIREPLFECEEILKHAIYCLTGNETEAVLCMGYGADETKPMIMAKVLNPEFNLDLKQAKVFINEVV